MDCITNPRHLLTHSDHSPRPIFSLSTPGAAVLESGVCSQAPLSPVSPPRHSGQSAAVHPCLRYPYRTHAGSGKHTQTRDLMPAAFISLRSRRDVSLTILASSLPPPALPCLHALSTRLPTIPYGYAVAVSLLSSFCHASLTPVIRSHVWNGT